MYSQTVAMMTMSVMKGLTGGGDGENDCLGGDGSLPCFRVVWGKALFFGGGAVVSGAHLAAIAMFFSMTDDVDRIASESLFSFSQI
jgi:hypothetical protein